MACINRGRSGDPGPGACPARGVGEGGGGGEESGRCTGAEDPKGKSLLSKGCLILIKALTWPDLG